MNHGRSPCTSLNIENYMATFETLIAGKSNFFNELA